MMKKIIIRADGNAQIGAGHLMRCLTVAETIEAKENVLFVCADEQSAMLAMENGFSAFVLNTDYRDMLSEMPVWEQMKEENVGGLDGGAVTFLVDSYFVNNEYLGKLRALGRIVLLDDMAVDVKDADVIVNYNAYATEKMYEPFINGKNVRIHAGSAFIPVRPDFVERGYSVKENVADVLITTGGGDKDNIAGQILDTIYVEGITYHVVTGRFNPHYEALCRYAEKHPGVHILHDVKDMAGLMEKCDLAVTAGGTTVYELCSIGVPFICFSYAENQERLVTYIGEKQIAFSAGKYHGDAEKCLEEIKASFDKLTMDFTLRRKCSQAERTVVDGLGAKRIAQLLEK